MLTIAEFKALPNPRRHRKFGNVKVEHGGKKFDSKRELKRWLILQGRESRGEISELERQVTYQLAPSVGIAGEKRARPALRFKADFRYIECGHAVVEDAKGRADTAFRIRQHLMKAIHGIDVRLS